MAFVYSHDYYADIGLHVFPILKYRLLYERLTEADEFLDMEYTRPEPANRAELLLVHSDEYLDDLDNCRWTARTRYSELPISHEIVRLFRLACGGSAAACRLALQHKWCMHMSGGFHHAFADRAEGFCYLNDLAVAARVVQQEGLVNRVAIIDCDLHQGNGTAVIFQGDESVFTYSIHQRDLYPVKEQSDLDIHLDVNTGDSEYMQHLHNSLPDMFAEFKPDLVLYQAGADPYEGDQLGNLSLSIAGLKQRDAYLFGLCRDNQVPVAVTLGGGYAYKTDDTVEIHYNTCLAAQEVFGV
jgi:acetoin utilization deacetylase AcuC-like enzyme